MPFAIMTRDKPNSSALRLQLRDAHLSYLSERQNTMLAGGAMLDEVRRLSFLPRSAVAFNKTHNETLHALSSELGRAPTQAEMAEYMGKDLDDFQKERGKARRIETYSL